MFHLAQFVRKKAIPPFSVADGLDFGDFNRVKDLPTETKLVPLSLIEKHLIGRVRLYASIVKFSKDRNSLVIKGHVINFFQDGPDVAAKKLSTLPDFEALFKEYIPLLCYTT